MKKETKSVKSESAVHKVFRHLFGTLFWMYVVLWIGIVVCAICAGISANFSGVQSVIVSRLSTTFYNARSLIFLMNFGMLLMTIIGACFKLLRKRTILVPSLIVVITAVCGQVVDYVTQRDVASHAVSASGIQFRDTLTDDGYGYSGGYYESSAPIIADNSKYTHTSENSVKITAQEPVSTFSIDVDTSSYANVRSYLNRNQVPPTDAVRVEEMINYFPYDYAAPKSKKHPFAIHTTLTESPWKKGNKLLHIGIKGYEPEEYDLKPLNLVLLIDTSGSMYGADRLDLLKQGFNMLVDQMKPEDTLSIVTYAGSSEVLLQPTSGAEKQKIKSAISSLSASGGTWGEGGLKKAYELAEANFDENAVNRILLGTDGDFNIGNVRDESLMDYVSRHSKKGIYLSILNVGRDNYNDALMQKLAQNGNGVGYYLDSIMEAKRVLSDDIKKTLFPIADDVKIQVEFNPAQVAEYRLIGYETRLLNREDFNNDKVDAGEINAGHTVTAIYELTPVGSDNRLVDDLRYGKNVETDDADKLAETAFVRVRYKLPGEEESNLIEKVVKKTVDLDDVSDDVRFSIAVAGFGQKLKASKFVDWDWRSLRRFAKNAMGRDEYEYREDFIQLIKKAESLVKNEGQ